jgi:hypothetical protein
MLCVLVVALWLVVGAAVGVIEARHGAWHGGWVVSAIFGLFAVPRVWDRRHQARRDPTMVPPGRARPGLLDLLIGTDGSVASMSAGSFALELFGPRARRVTLATALDVDIAARWDDAFSSARRSIWGREW